MLDENPPQLPTPGDELFKVPSLLDKIKDVVFTKVTDEKSNLMYDHDSYFHIYYSADKEDASHQEKIEQIRKYVDALALKLLEESKNIYSNIDALPTFVDSVKTSSNTIIDNVLAGIDKYSPFISELEEDGKTFKDKPVIMAIKIGITKTNAVLPTPMLIWIVSSHSWKNNETNPDNFDLINTIELFSE